MKMKSLGVKVEKLPEVVIAALKGPNVKQDLESLQSMPALDMTTVAMLLRRKIQYPMPLLEVCLERLPDSVMSTLATKKNGCAVIPLSEIYAPRTSLVYPKIPKGPSLVVALERIPEDTMTSLLASRKATLLASKGKKKTGQRKNKRQI